MNPDDFCPTRAHTLGRCVLGAVMAAWHEMSEAERFEFYNWVGHVGDELGDAWNDDRRMPDWKKIRPEIMRR